MAFVEVIGRQCLGQASHHLEFDWVAGGPTLVAGWSFDGASLSVSADRLGFIPLFYAREGRRLIVADSLQEVAARLSAPTFDDEAIAVFMALGYLVGDQTPLAGVKVLMPGETLLWREGVLSGERSAIPLMAAFPGDPHEARTRFAELFARAIERRAAGGVGRLPLSGGRDSRHICLELARQGTPPPRTLVLQAKSGDETGAAQAVSRHLDIECQVIEMSQDRVAAEWQKNRLNHYSTDENSWYLELLPYLDGPVFDGLAGDILSNGNYFDARMAECLDAGDLAGATNRLLAGGSYTAFLKRPFQERWGIQIAREAINRELSAHAGAPDPVKSFLFWSRIRREIALLPIAMAGQQHAVCLPYQDPDVLAFLLSLPWQSFAMRAFHDEVIKSHYPHAAHIPYSQKPTEPRPRAEWTRISRSAAHLARPLFNVFTRPERVVAYTLEALRTGRTRPLSPTFVKVMPLLQAVQELGVDPHRNQAAPAVKVA
ncbi:asparagine synthase-related protein [Thioalkalivibrio sp. ALJ2]|uniref:asparagine synthase-related protein n=1 Tax=Thioalkalivibrio sp. ALJ2 TaxID=1261622 RepID=UPI00037B68E4|nr:asparagine synthase-related protein [Thioalkalivibrio sp. ALJ2]